MSYIASLLARQGTVVLVAVISPYREVRAEIRAQHGIFLEVFANADLSVCEARDCKGLYRQARSGMTQQFTGVSDPYEPPVHPDVKCRTDRETIEESCAKVIRAIDERITSASL